MKIVQINKVKVSIFQEQELKEKLGMCEKDIELVTTYQRTFPELLQDENGFCIDGETLCEQLGVRDDFNNWLLRETKGKEGKLIKYKCIENTDFICDWENPNAKFTKEDIKNMSPQQRSANKIKNKIKLTLECAKKIAMRQNNNKGDMVCNYFILMEKTLRNYEKWVAIRNPEKQNANAMKSHIAKWCDKNGFDKSLETFYTREFNLLNESLTGFNAQGIKNYLKYKDIQTREHLDCSINSALDFLQKLNISLLDANMSFEERTRIIKITCDTQYSDLKF